MAEVKLSQGKIAIVDDADLPLLSGYKWTTAKRPHTCYAQACLGNQTYLLMHRLLAGQEGLGVDHIDGNGLNNRRSNLRPATQNQNGANQRARPGGSSRFKGVSWSEDRQKWLAQIKTDRRRNLGRFLNEEEAARTYDRAALEAFGEFALTNEMMGLYSTGS